MLTKSKVIFASVIVLGLLAWWLFPFGGEEAAIKKQLKEIVALVEKENAESMIEAAMRSRKLSAFFVDGARIEYLPGRSVRVEGDVMAGAFLQARGMAESISIWVMRHEVALAEDAASAVSTVKASAGVSMQGGETESQTLTHQLDWRKVDGDWRISGVQVISD
ncbi:nuclear transport factor 2 family protein [Coraliomargarita parva]|uniref:nuclear transport factor 2 family protein n=1 Tax=Coraliomargarita parva TaxID=3014050 RepID=UPI0022B4D99D|nr:nuclear transport factor 2 family protein [Coraliomargarita parva]